MFLKVVKSAKMAKEGACFNVSCNINFIGSEKQLIVYYYDFSPDASLNIDYNEIYRYTERELIEKSFTYIELFQHFIVTCHKIFSLSEFRYGKNPKNIPADFPDAILSLYESKIKNVVPEPQNIPKEKYSYTTSCVDYPEEKFSIKNLAESLLQTISELITVNEKYNSLWKLNNDYMKNFFGIKFTNGEDSDATKYETLRLLKILHDCIYECKIDLSYLLRMSFVHKNTDMPNSYSKAFSFIKQRVLVRNVPYQMDFQTIMGLEKYNNSLRSFINSFSEGVVDNILSYIPNSSNLRCSIIRYVYSETYKSVINNISKLQSSELSNDDMPRDVTTIQCYAYEHFLMMDFYRSEYLDFYSKIFVVEASEEFYSRLENFTSKHKEVIPLDNITEFITNYEEELIKILYPHTLKGTIEYKKFATSIKRHSEDYRVIANVYSSGHNNPLNTNLNSFELINIIYLRETLSRNSTDINLYSGYNPSDKTRRSLKIQRLSKQLGAKLENKTISTPLSDEEFFLACHWLVEQMHTLINYRTIEIQNLREQMKLNILQYWHHCVPLMSQQYLSVNLENFMELILPKQQQEQILRTAKNLQKNISF